MKIPVLCLLIVLFIHNIALSQDVITKKNGETINAKVLKVNPVDIEYKLYHNEDGPLHTMPVSSITQIRYVNGTKDTFPDMQTGTTASYTYGALTLAERGRLDAKIYYKGKGPLIGGAVSAIYPGYGLISVAIISVTKPRYETLNFPDPELMDNYEYKDAYMRKAFKIKQAKAWEGYGIGTGILATVAAAIIIGVLTTH